MRLKQIKLAGFKSFVDPTKVIFKEQMTSIVGPNGCGKSNVIDAVRWVLGESSAKNLRGDSMTDVIFNGAASRKPVSQASVELVFENTAGRLQGSMADRNEVSIRRVVHRDHTSNFFLNGSKCRRRDITDIFLGTGLGPRSYAIIEQGTISRLIESKPQELRVFIEEAAGISKYKIRRHDTETRIRHTRENLERLSDIRHELAQQIEKLEQQCEAAKRFKTLKASERQYKAELAALRWQQFDQKNQLNQQKIKVFQTDIEDLTSQQDHQTSQIYQAKQSIESAGDSFTKLQQQKLQLGTDLARVEQSVKHAKQQKADLGQNSEQCQQRLLKVKQDIVTQQQALLPLQGQLDQYQPQLIEAGQQIDNLGIKLEQIVSEQQAWQQSWDAHNDADLKYNKQNGLIENQVATQQALLQSSQARIKSVQDELLGLSQQDAAPCPKAIADQLSLADGCLIALKFRQQGLGEQQLQLQTQQNQANQQIASQQGLKTALHTQLQQLKTQQNKQQDWQIAQQRWLSNKGITNPSLLYQQCQVEPDWQRVTEVVLSAWLQASVVGQLPQSIELDTAFMVQRDLASAPLQPSQVVNGTLAEKVQSGGLLLPILNHIYVANDLAQAYAMLPQLAQHQSIVCQDTSWLGHGFLRKGSVLPASEFLQRSQTIAQIEQNIAQVNKLLSEHKSQLELDSKNFSVISEQQQTLQGQIQKQQAQCQQLAQSMALAVQQKTHHEQQSLKCQTELAQLEQQSKQQQVSYRQYLSQQSQLEQQRPPVERNQTLTMQREQLAAQLQTAQGKIKHNHDKKHRLVLAIEQAKSQRAQHQHLLKRLQDDVAELTGQLRAYQQQVEQNVLPLVQDEQQQQIWLSQMLSLDDKLVANKQIQSSAQHSIKQLEQQRNQNRQSVEQLHQKVSQHQLESESQRLRAETALEQLAGMQRNITDVLATMPSSAKEGVWQANIMRLANEISTLGAINLAAIDEFESQSQRKTLLDQQTEDLNQAINTLGSAISKIDKESRQKFKITFEQINEGIKSLFPKVFGGGSAYLTLTGDDLLDAGVSIMARPPGKKNSTIHLLSGGEKALTALSLVFAIFRLNPAPFCLLDEVDAPLDDANVVRFCNLVREMSQTVQFIYISHNKIAMEMASQLTGVTMFEPGVSRLVSVDIDEAIAMAEVS